MILKNPWVGYLDRSYLQIKNSILKRLGESTPELTDHSESNILVIIVSLFSGVGEMLNYYIDNMAREAFITTARRYSSVVKHTRLIDYRIKATIPSSTNLTITFLNLLNLPTNIKSQLYIPQGTVFKTKNNIIFISTVDVIGNIGDYSVNIPIQQKTLISNISLGTTTAVEDQLYEIGEKYVHNSILLIIGGEYWQEVDTLGRSGPTDKHYVVDITADRKAFIKFGDNINGLVPNPGLDIVATYYISEGIKGNVDSNTITQTDFTFNLLDLQVTTVNITNQNKAVAGTDYESIERIRRSAPLHIRTLERAVTRQDYIDLAMLSPGVDKATVHFECGKTVDIYISPNGGGIASQPLLQSTLDYMQNKKMITTMLNVLPAGESKIVLDIEVWAKFRMDPIQTKNDIINALDKNYNYDASDVNRKIRKSDIIALIDNLEKVDYLNINFIYLKPYFRAKQSGTNELIADTVITEKSVEKIIWTLQYDGNYIRVMRNYIHEGNITIGQTYTDSLGILNITVQPNNYVLGDEWEFTTYPFNRDIETDDFTVPVIDLDNTKIKVNKQIIL